MKKIAMLLLKKIQSALRQVCVLAVAAILSACSVYANEDAMYRDVAANENWEAAGELYIRNAGSWDKIQPYIIRGDRLYLLVQKTRTVNYLYVQVDTKYWTSDEIGDFAKDAKFKSRLPDPAAESGGIEWLGHPNADVSFSKSHHARK